MHSNANNITITKDKDEKDPIQECIGGNYLSGSGLKKIKNRKWWRTSKSCSPGYWTGQVETEAAVLVSKLPKVIDTCVRAKEDVSNIGTDNLSQTIYHNSNRVLKLVNDGNDYPIDKAKISKLCEINVLPKTGSGLNPLLCAIYQVVPDDHKHINFIYVTHDETILSYARFHIKHRQTSTANAYGEQPLLTIEAMETYQRGIYSFGTLIAQIIYEYSINNRFDGRIALYSANESGQFYYKIGFTPLDQLTYSYIKAEHQTDGKIMFFTDAAIDEWRIRVSQSPILLNEEKISHLPENKIIDSSISTGGIFGHDSTQTRNLGTQGLSTPDVILTKKASKKLAYRDSRAQPPPKFSVCKY